MKWMMLTVGLLAGLLIGSNAKATLLDRGPNMVYDDVLNITWVADANLCLTLNNCVNSTTGFMTEGDANTWAANLDYQGFTDWRLPSMDVNGDTTVVDCSSATEVACRDNEYGYMYYQNLGGTFGSNLTGDQGPFTNVQPSYWSGTEFAPKPLSAWVFFFDLGIQGIVNKGGVSYAWAVRPGDVASVPEPGSVVLMGVGLLGLGLARRWRGR